MNVAALDIGSNSFHLLIVEKTDKGLVPIQRYKDKVQLGAGLDADNYLSNRAIQRGLTTVTSFIKHLNEHNVSKVYTAATNTLRLAKNGAQFITEAEAILMQSINIISGDKEAELIFEAVTDELNYDGTGLVIDIGGGSTEFAIGSMQQTKHTITTDYKNSAQMGCVNYQRRFFSDGKIFNENMQAAITSGRLSMEPMLSSINKYELNWIIGTSGTLQSIAEICAQLYHGSENRLLRSQLQDLKKRLILVGHSEQLNFKCLDSNRKKILPAGLAISLAIMQTLDCEEMEIGQASLCEGMLIHALGQSFLTSPAS